MSICIYIYIIFTQTYRYGYPCICIAQIEIRMPEVGMLQMADRHFVQNKADTCKLIYHEG